MTLNIARAPKAKEAQEYMIMLNGISKIASEKSKKGSKLFRRPSLKLKRKDLQNSQMESIKQKINKNWENEFREDKNYVEAFILDKPNQQQINLEPNTLRKKSQNLKRIKTLEISNKDTGKVPCFQTLKFNSYLTQQDYFADFYYMEKQEYCDEEFDYTQLYYCIYHNHFLQAKACNQSQISKLAKEKPKLACQDKYENSFTSSSSNCLISYHLNKSKNFINSIYFSNFLTKNIEVANDISKNKLLCGDDARAIDLKTKPFSLICFASSVFALSFCFVRILSGGFTEPLALILTSLFR
ncbi:MAG: hypothetical protein MJ189_00615 [Coriobacteriales bacterium]|nr:hypothetical protein [Coriobacteriales bacterium]